MKKTLTFLSSVSLNALSVMHAVVHRKLMSTTPEGTECFVYENDVTFTYLPHSVGWHPYISRGNGDS